MGANNALYFFIYAVSLCLISRGGASFFSKMIQNNSIRKVSQFYSMKYNFVEIYKFKFFWKNLWDWHQSQFEWSLDWPRQLLEWSNCRKPFLFKKRILFKRVSFWIPSLFIEKKFEKCWSKISQNKIKICGNHK